MAGMEEPNERRMEMDSFDGKAKEGEQGAVALVLDLAKAFERVSLPVVWAWATQDISGVVWLLRAPEGEYSLKDVWQSRSRPSRPSCLGRSGAVCFYAFYCRLR